MGERLDDALRVIGEQRAEELIGGDDLDAGGQNRLGAQVAQVAGEQHINMPYTAAAAWTRSSGSDERSSVTLSP